MKRILFGLSAILASTLCQADPIYYHVKSQVATGCTDKSITAEISSIDRQPNNVQASTTQHYAALFNDGRCTFFPTKLKLQVIRQEVVTTKFGNQKAVLVRWVDDPKPTPGMIYYYLMANDLSIFH